MIAFSISFPGRVRGTADPSASRDDKGKGGDSGKGNADACCPATTFHKTVALPFVIPRGCDFFDFSCFWYTPPECFSELPQDRHPERSASRIYRLTEGLQRVVEGPRRCLSCLCCSELFDYPSPSTEFFLRYALDRSRVHLFMHCNHLPSPSL